jgi:hypothetical protein
LDDATRPAPAIVLAVNVTRNLIRRYLIGDRRTIAGTVYGTIIALSVLAAGAHAYQHHLWRLASIVAISALVLWVAHIYAHGIGESVAAGRRLTMAEVGDIARREYSIVLSAVLPVAALVLGAAGVLDERTSLRWAFGVGIFALAVQGIRYARLEELGRWAAIASVSLNLALGLAIVAVEAFVTH